MHDPTTFRIVIVTHDDHIASDLIAAFAPHGDRVERATTLLEAKELFSYPADVGLLEVDMPGGQALNFCRELVTTFPCMPIVLLSDFTAKIDIATGLDAGAVDFLALPIRANECISRVRGRLRTSPASPQRFDINQKLAVGDVALDRLSRMAWVAGREVRLRTKEFDLLAYFLSRPGVVLTRGELMQAVWKQEWWGESKTLDVHVGALRRRLDDGDGGDVRIVAVRGAGYRFQPRGRHEPVADWP
jgi:DNA-binding response OmpR family regulator